jgi:hypothetical protein
MTLVLRSPGSHLPVTERLEFNIGQVSGNCKSNRKGFVTGEIILSHDKVGDSVIATLGRGSVGTPGFKYQV